MLMFLLIITRVYVNEKEIKDEKSFLSFGKYLALVVLYQYVKNTYNVHGWDYYCCNLI